MSEITREQAINLAITVAKWHREWMDLRLKALSLSDAQGHDFLMNNFPIIRGSREIDRFKKFTSMPCDQYAAWQTIKKLVEAAGGGDE